MKKQFYLKGLMMALLLFVGVNAWGDTQPTSVSFTFGYAQWDDVTASFSGSDKDEVTQTKSNIVCTYTRNGSFLYANNSALRLYKSNTLKFEAPSGYKITAISFTCTSYKTDITSDPDTCTATSSALSWANANGAATVTFTRPSNASGYATISGATVTLASTKTLSSLVVSGTPTKTTYIAGEAFNPAGLVVTGTYSDSSKETITKDIQWTFDYGKNNEALVAGATSIDVMASVGNVDSDVTTISGLTVNAAVISTITLNTNGGTINAGNVTEYTEGFGATLPTDVTKTGYTFAGWRDNSELTGEAVTSISTSATGTQTFWAKWTAHTYSVKFNANGGTGTMSDQSFTYDEAAKTLTANAFTKTGYSFAGWATTSTGAKAYDNEQSVQNLTADDAAIINLYALWTAKQSVVTLSAPNATTAGTAQVTATYGSAMPSATMPSRTGYTFNGFFDAASSGTKYYNGTGSSARNWNKEDATSTLYAQWTAKSYSVTFNKNNANATGSMTNQSITFDASANLKSNAFVLENYTFQGWATTADGAVAYADGASYTMTTEGATLYAVWAEKPTHSVTFYVNGVAGTPVQVHEGESVTFNNVTESIPTGYAFMGWYGSTYSNASDAPTYVTSATMGTQDLKYYAVFAAVGGTPVTWTKTDISEVTAGTYALITTDGHAFNGTISSGNGQVTSTAFSFTDNVASSAPSGTLEITITASGDGYTMYNAGKGYLYASAASSGKLAWHATEDSYWSYTSENWIYAKNGAYMRSYNNNSIRSYASTSGAVLVMAKKNGGITYSNYRTDISHSRSVTSDTYGTVCLPYNVSNAGITGAKYYQIEGKKVNGSGQPTSIALSEVDNLVAGTPYIFKSTANEISLVYSGSAANAAGSNNGLHGTFERHPFATDANYTEGNYFVVQDTKIQAASNQSGVNAYRAYIVMSEVPVTQSAKAITIGIDGMEDEVSAIDAVDAELDMNAPVYNLAGQRVSHNTKGIVIQNGRKFINK